MSPAILIIEDDASIQEFVKVALIDEGFEVLSAADGQEALRLLRERRPALILLDFRMPIMDGYTFLQRYRQTAPPIPVIAITAARFGPDEALPEGVDYLVEKPFDLNHLITIIQSYVNQSSV